MHLLPTLLRRDAVTFGRVGWLPFRLPNRERDTHVYVIGASGTGKSKFLESMFINDVKAGRGCGLVDPHGDLARDAVAHLAEDGYFKSADAYKRVIYFDPARMTDTIAFNVLRSGLSAYTVANQVIEAIRRTWPQSLREAPRFTNIVLVSLLALIEAKKSLVELPRMMTDKAFRDEVLVAVRDPFVLEFFRLRYDQWGRGLLIESVLNKVTAFTLNPHLRRCLGANTNSLDFLHLMDAGKVVIANLGNCDGETRRLIGSLITTGLEQAATARSADRRHFYVYVDEFQDFCAGEGGSLTFAQSLSESRKYNLHWHLAHQTMGQIQSRVESALGNVGIKVVFALDDKDAEVMAHKLFVDYINVLSWKEATALIQSLPFRTAFVKGRNRRLVRMQTQFIKPYSTKINVTDVIDKLVATHAMPSSNVVTHVGQARIIHPTALSDWEQPISTVTSMMQPS